MWAAKKERGWVEREKRVPLSTGHAPLSSSFTRPRPELGDGPGSVGWAGVVHADVRQPTHGDRDRTSGPHGALPSHRRGRPWPKKGLSSLVRLSILDSQTKEKANPR